MVFPQFSRNLIIKKKAIVKKINKGTENTFEIKEESAKLLIDKNIKGAMSLMLPRD